MAITFPRTSVTRESFILHLGCLFPQLRVRSDPVILPSLQDPHQYSVRRRSARSFPQGQEHSLRDHVECVCLDIIASLARINFPQFRRGYADRKGIAEP